MKRMSERTVKNGKVIVSIVWLLVLASVIVPAQLPFAGVFQGVGVFLIVAHSIEIVMYRRLMRGVSDYFGTMLFGLLQLQSIKS